MEDVKIGDVVAIARDANVTGKVTLAQPKRRLGRTGKLDFSIERVTAADQSSVPLRYTVNKTDGGSRAVSTGALTAGVAILFFPAAPFVLLRTGKEATAEKGMIFEVFTDQAHALSVKADTKNSQINITSVPSGADVEINGGFVGSTPLSVDLPADEYEIILKKKGFLDWSRRFKAVGSSVGVNAELEAETAAIPAVNEPAWPDSSEPSAVPSLEGSRWLYTDADEEFEIEFMQGGKLRIHQPADVTPDNDNWEVNGNILHLYQNDRYVTYRGSFAGNDLIRGTVVSANAPSWTFEMRRARAGTSAAESRPLSASTSEPPRGDSATVKFEGESYVIHIGAIGKNEAGQTSVELLGDKIGGRISIRDGKTMPPPVGMKIAANGKTFEYTSVNILSASCVFNFDTTAAPEKIIVYGNDGSDSSGAVFDGKTRRLETK
jgi:hypothetical protein